MRLFAFASVLLTALFGVVVGALRLQPPNPAISAAFGDCLMPCWEGVQTGVTMQSDALRLLRARGWVLRGNCNAAIYDLCYNFGRADADPIAYIYVAQNQVKEIGLFRSGWTIGDLWLALGAPEKAAISPRAHQAIFLNSALWFSPSQISTQMRSPCPAGFADLLRFPLDTMLVWEPGTEMEGVTLSSVADLRQAIHQVCNL